MSLRLLLLLTTLIAAAKAGRNLGPCQALTQCKADLAEKSTASCGAFDVVPNCKRQEGAACLTCASGYTVNAGACQKVGTDGGWSEWRMGTCTNNMMTLSRYCDNPAPADGGADCQGDAQKQSKCNKVEPLDPRIDQEGLKRCADGCPYESYGALSNNIARAIHVANKMDHAGGIKIFPGEYSVFQTAYIEDQEEYKVYGSGMGDTILDASQAPRDGAVRLGCGSKLDMRDLTIKNYDATVGWGAVRMHAGHCAKQSWLKLTRVEFKDNHADSGAALGVQGGETIVDSCKFEGNEARNGGVLVTGYAPKITMKDCIFNDNKSTRGADWDYCHAGTDPFATNNKWELTHNIINGVKDDGLFKCVGKGGWDTKLYPTFPNSWAT